MCSFHVTLRVSHSLDLTQISIHFPEARDTYFKRREASLESMDRQRNISTSDRHI